MRNVLSKSAADIYAEWDMLAPIRLRQIESGQDLTFNHVLSPAIHKLAEVKSGPVLDLGCGVGVMAEEFSRLGWDVIGIDPSRVSISLARQVSSGQVNYESYSAEEYASKSKKKFSTIVSNMVLMDTIDLHGFMQAVAALLKRGGAFVFSITHPCFWPEYYGYSDAEWFEYNKELIVESPFRISNQQDCRLNSTHVHRPLEQYVKAIVDAGLSLEALIEPFPPETIRKLYPRPWKYPRYLVGRCRLPKKI